MRYGIITAEARALENPKIEPSEVKNMKKKIMKKFADLATTFGEMNLSHLLAKGKKAFKNKHLSRDRLRYGRVEALRKTCFSTLPYLSLSVNKYNYLH